MPDPELELGVVPRHLAPFPNESLNGYGQVGGANPMNSSGRKPEGA